MSEPTAVKRTRHFTPAVFWPSVALILVFVLLAAAKPEGTNSVIANISSVVVKNAGWCYILAVAGFVVFALVVAVSRKGDTVLGPDDAEPEYSRGSWFAMLFAAGMGIGLVFWGAAEPLQHYNFPRPGSGVKAPGSTPSPDAARDAMNTTFLHWGLHAWAVYVVVGLAIAYAVYRKGMPVSMRWTLKPIFGDRIKGRVGDVIDIVAIVGTIFGIAMSLGFGVKQLAGGTEHLTGWKASNGMLVGFVVVIAGLAAISVATGLDAGIKFLSNFNLVIAAILMAAVAILGPTLFLADEFVADLGNFFDKIIDISLETLPFSGETGSKWLSDWTLNYWGWWISWSPFVGIFIARISRGRTVREFIIGVLLVPTLVTFIWFAIFGGNGLYQQMFGHKNFIGPDGTINADIALFQTFDNMPMTVWLSVLAMLVLVIFFVTSSDSGSYVMSMMATGGNPNPALRVRLTFAALSGAIAAVMLGVGNSEQGMKALQTMAILVALPFSIIMVLMCVSLWRELARERTLRKRIESEEYAGPRRARGRRGQGRHLRGDHPARDRNAGQADRDDGRSAAVLREALASGPTPPELRRSAHPRGDRRRRGPGFRTRGGSRSRRSRGGRSRRGRGLRERTGSRRRRRRRPALLSARRRPANRFGAPYRFRGLRIRPPVCPIGPPVTGSAPRRPGAEPPAP